MRTDEHDIRKAKIEDAILAKREDDELFVIHKPIHDPFGYYRENACGYTTLENAWRVPWDIAQRYVSGKKTDPDRVVVEPAPPRKEDELAALRAKCERLEGALKAWEDEFGTDDVKESAAEFDEQYRKSSQLEAQCAELQHRITALLAVIEKCEKAWTEILENCDPEEQVCECRLADKCLAAIKRVKEETKCDHDDFPPTQCNQRDCITACVEAERILRALWPHRGLLRSDYTRVEFELLERWGKEQGLS